MARRVVITGLGIHCAIGSGCNTVAEALAQGRSGVAPIQGFDPAGLKSPIAAEIADFVPAAGLTAKHLSLLDRHAAFAASAAIEAVDNAGADLAGDRTAVIIGTGGASLSTLDQEYFRLYGQAATRLHPFTVPRIMANAAASHITIRYGITGPSFTISSACSSGAHAIGLGYQMIQAGLVDQAIVGGAEAGLTFGNLKAWEGLKVMAPRYCRPFSADREGMVMGEGAAVVVLETLTAAQNRTGPVRAEIRGFAMTSDAHDPVHPSLDGAKQVFRQCLANADLQAGDIEYINAHGTGTGANDAVEAQAIHSVFGNHVDGLAISSTKSMHGHTLGAAGAIECVVTILALERGFLPPTINFTTADPDCALDVVPNAARPCTASRALSTSFAFGGSNAVLALDLDPD